jgi:hypothetical protein
MAQRFVKQWGTDKKVSVDTEATKGATLGVDLYYNGVLLDPDLILNSAALASTGTSLSTPSVSNKSTASTDFVPEGATNKYVTAQNVQAVLPFLGISTLGLDGSDGFDSFPSAIGVSSTVINTVTLGSSSSMPLAMDGNDGLDGFQLPPSGAALGDLGGTYPNPTVTGIEGYPIGAPPTLNASIPIWRSSGAWNLNPISGDATMLFSGALTIAANAVTNAKAAQMAANTIKLNNTSATANATDGTPPQLAAMLSGCLPALLPMDGSDGFDAIPLVGQTGAAGSAGPGVSNPVCRLTTGSSTNLASLSGSQTVDGFSTAAGDLILLRGQTTTSQNGPWVASAGAWTRPTWYASGNTTQAFFGLLFNVTDGTVYGGGRFYISTTGTLTIDTSSVAFQIVLMQNSGLTTVNGVTTNAGGWQNAALAQMAANTIKGNNTSGSTTPADLTAAQTRTVIGVGGLGTSDAATTAMTASTQVVVPGTKFQLATGLLNVGTVFRFTVGLDKTAAGAATFTVKLCFGTSGTNADAAIATWTSGTNTALADYATLTIDVRITAIGASATAAAIAFYSNTATDSTGLGRISPVPGSTATFASTATTPFFHVDVTCGAGTTMTAWGSAQQLVA